MFGDIFVIQVSCTVEAGEGISAFANFALLSTNPLHIVELYLLELSHTLRRKLYSQGKQSGGASKWSKRLLS